MPTANGAATAAALAEMASTFTSGYDFRLILMTAAISFNPDTTTVANVVANEVSSSALSARPTWQFPSIGTWDATNTEHDLPPSTQVSFTPSSPLNVPAFAIIRGGSATPGSTTGLLVGYWSLGTTVTYPASANVFNFPWTLKSRY